MGFKLPLTIQSYQTKDRSISSQRLVNMFVEQMPADSKNSVALFNTEGCRPFLNITQDPVYGFHFMAPYLYVFSGVSVFRVSESGEVKNIGNIGATNGIVRSADNGTQIVVIKPNGEGYLVTEESVELMNYENFPTASDVAFNSQYFVVSEKNSGKFYWSGLLDGKSWSALAYATQESNPDNVVGLIENKGDLWIFGDKTTEIWTPTGSADLPFQRIGSGILNIGCKAKKTIAKDKNGIYWLGNDLQIHFAQGYNETRISTHYIEDELSRVYDIEDVINAYAFTYSNDGHDFYVFTIPNGKTFVFDMATKVWHERKTYGLKTWLPSSCTAAFNKNIVGDSQTGQLYVLDGEYYFDKEKLPLEREIIFPTLSMDDGRLIYDKFYMDIETAPGKDLTLDPQVMLTWSDDGGRLWKSEHWKGFGKPGEYRKRVIWRCLGQARQRIYKIRITDPVKVSLSGLFVEGSQCYA